MSSSSDVKSVLASAPGKVLIAGGYLVLDRAFQGFVIGTSSRFYSAVQEGASARTICVRSPQFEKAVWRYDLIEKEGEVALVPRVSEGENKFVQICLTCCLSVVFSAPTKRAAEVAIQKGLDIQVFGDNDFYSQREQLKSLQLPLTVKSLEQLPHFCPTKSTLGNVHKTGLGSSAALITSLVASVLVYFNVTSTKDLSAHEDRILVHNTAQLVHCLAQGKIGSGFDVSAAVWGSHTYRRFSPNVLEAAMEDPTNTEVVIRTIAPSNSSWDNEVTSFQLPPSHYLMLADIDAGSHTPTLVSKVLAWRKANPQVAENLWQDLSKSNAALADALIELQKLAVDDAMEYEAAIEACRRQPASKWTHLVEADSENASLKSMARVHERSQNSRRLIREMSELAGVPIEPPEQTRLLDACLNVAGVVMCGVPGAGGFDAIYCIVLSNEAMSEVQNLWAAWKELSVGPLLSREDSAGVTIELDSNIPRST
ncbi:hypothetical protein BZG36_02021 [Bifiguratus adelaidae]|uniref:Phosphomevalonate kinase n=1 Tax=Bifiguratus adelaidae TaxID=1938954 RepID=A0A261Y222_9FUNG|nr:hypothetical protein BZG36_02021 [Bifiguratus adelaidae]